MGDNRTSDKTVSTEIKNKRYSIILFIMSIITFFGLIKLRNKFDVKTFGIYIFIGSIFGWTWQIFITYMDPQCAGWWYEPHKIWGSVGLVAYEDIVFYPICGALFYLVRLVIPMTKSKIDPYLKITTLITLCLLGILSLIIFNTGGKSSTYWFLIPGLGMFIYSYKEINIGRFLFTGLFIIVLASVWDLWIKDWFYITADLLHSNLWLDYKTHKWAWIGRSPVEITPWFSISGWVFIYPLAQVCEKKFSKSV